MNALEEIKLLRKQYKLTIENSSIIRDKNEFIFVTLMNIKKPYTDLINLMGEIRKEINDKCSDYKIKELGQSLDTSYNVLFRERISNEFNSSLDYRIYRYNQLKSEYSSIISNRKELQCKYTYLKKILPKVEKLIIDFENNIVQSRQS